MQECRNHERDMEETQAHLKASVQPYLVDSSPVLLVIFQHPGPEHVHHLWELLIHEGRSTHTHKNIHYQRLHHAGKTHMVKSMQNYGLVSTVITHTKQLYVCVCCTYLAISPIS